MPRTLASLLLHLYLCGWAAGLRAVRLWVPEAVRAGASVRLSCDYDLEAAALYSIKWYRGDEEFYRFVPKEAPPTQVFPLPGMQVDISLSDAREVTLLNVQHQLTGLYKCEVSADAPLFHTEIKAAFMTVVDVPPEPPSITVDKRRYAAGDQVRANCTSRASFPAANVTWFVNGQRVLTIAPTMILTEPGGSLETIVSTLELEADRSAFPDSKIRIWCAASLFNVYYKSSEEVELHEDTPQIASVLGPSISDASSTLRMSAPLLVVICHLFLVTICR